MQRKNPTWGIIGVGQLGACIAEGIYRSRAPFDLVLSPRGKARVRELAERFPVAVGTDNQEVVDRKSANPRTMYIPQASVSVTGGIQPVILHRALGIEHRESGLAARLLLTCPPRKPKRWTEADIDPNAEVELARLVCRLYDLQPNLSDRGVRRPGWREKNYTPRSGKMHCMRCVCESVPGIRPPNLQPSTREPVKQKLYTQNGLSSKSSRPDTPP